MNYCPVKIFIFLFLIQIKAYSIPGNIKYYYQDHIGSIKVVFDAESQQTIETNCFDPLGLQIEEKCNQITDNTTTEKYSGKELDNEGSSIGVKGLNLYYYGYRYYDPEIGRWISNEPDRFNKIGISPYIFVQNNPISNTDLLGLQVEPPKPPILEPVNETIDRFGLPHFEGIKVIYPDNENTNRDPDYPQNISNSSYYNCSYLYFIQMFYLALQASQALQNQITVNGFKTSTLDQNLNQAMIPELMPIFEKGVTPELGDMYGMRFHPIDKIWKAHTGIDIRVAFEKIYSSMPGEISAKGIYGKGTYGLQLDITGIGAYENIKLRYSHLKNISLNLEKGDYIYVGQFLAVTGGEKGLVTSGKSTNPHLHFEVLVKTNNQWVQTDPSILIPQLIPYNNYMKTPIVGSAK